MKKIFFIIVTSITACNYTTNTDNFENPIEFSQFCDSVDQKVLIDHNYFKKFMPIDTLCDTSASILGKLCFRRDYITLVDIDYIKNRIWYKLLITYKRGSFSNIKIIEIGKFISSDTRIFYKEVGGFNRNKIEYVLIWQFDTISPDTLDHMMDEKDMINERLVEEYWIDKKGDFVKVWPFLLPKEYSKEKWIPKNNVKWIKD
jgi:hypothetical protein